MKQLRQGDLFRAIGNIDDSYIEEALQPAAQRKIRPIRWAVLAACLSLAVGISVLAPLLLMDGSFSVLSSGSSPTPSGGESLHPPISDQIPAWYAPGELTARSLTYADGQLRLTAAAEPPSPAPLIVRSGAAASSRKLADNREIAIPSDARVIDCYNASLLQLDPQSVEGHAGCSGLFYDTEAGTLVCLSEILKEKLGGSLPGNSSLSITAYNGEYNRCLFHIQGDGGRSRQDYSYDLSADRLIQLPAVVGETDTVAALFPVYSPDLRTMAAVDAKDTNRPAALYLVRIGEDTAQAEQIAVYADEYVEPYKHLLFSPDSRYLVYALPDRESYPLVGSTAGEWIMRNLSTGSEWRGKGKILRFTADNAAVIVRTETAVKVLDIVSGKDITETAVLQEWEKWELLAVDNGNNFTGSRFRLTLNLLFGSDTCVLKEDVGAYCFSDGYLYTYSQGDYAAECLSIITGESFQVPVDPSYVQQTTGLPENVLVHHQLYLSNDGTRLLLRYSTSARDPNAELSQYAQDYNLPDLGRLFDTYGSLAEMEAYFRRGMNPPDLSAAGTGPVPSGMPAAGTSTIPFVQQPQYFYFEGDGYACVVHHTSQPEQLLLFVDDYRDNTFSIYTSYARHTSYWPIRDKTGPLRKALPADVKRAGSIPLYTSFPAYEDPIDLAAYYTGGKFNEEKMHKRELDFDLILARASNATISNYLQPEPGGWYIGYDIFDISPLEEALQIAASQPTIGWVTLQAERESKGCTLEYKIMISGNGEILEFTVGRLADGRGMLVYNSCYRTLDDHEYQRIMEICDALYAAARWE